MIVLWLFPLDGVTVGDGQGFLRAAHINPLFAVHCFKTLESVNRTLRVRTTILAMPELSS